MCQQSSIKGLRKYQPTVSSTSARLAGVTRNVLAALGFAYLPTLAADLTSCIRSILVDRKENKRKHNVCGESFECCTGIDKSLPPGQL